METINARYILTSYSTDGNIEAKDLLAANLKRGKVTLLTQDVPRYRVSKQRQSERARVLEFDCVDGYPCRVWTTSASAVGTTLSFCGIGWCGYFGGKYTTGLMVRIRLCL